MADLILHWLGDPAVESEETIVALIESMLANLKNELIFFYNNRLNDDDLTELVPPFWLGEQVTSTFVAAALMKTKGMRGNFLQEYPVSRQREKANLNGRVDYLCYLGKQFLAIELKQSFIRYCTTNGKVYFYALLNQHKAAMEQLVSLDNEAKLWLHWSLALSAAPVCLIGPCRGKTMNRQDVDVVFDRLKEKLCQDKRRTREKQFVCGFTLPKELSEIVVECDSRKESYPAVFFIGTLRRGLQV